jgi:hypothetical protein
VRLSDHRIGGRFYTAVRHLDCCGVDCVFSSSTVCVVCSRKQSSGAAMRGMTSVPKPELSERQSAGQMYDSVLNRNQIANVEG